MAPRRAFSLVILFMSDPVALAARLESLSDRTQALETYRGVSEHRLESLERRADEMMRHSVSQHEEIKAQLKSYNATVTDILARQNQRVGAESLAKWLTPVAISLSAVIISLVVFLS